MSQKPASPFAHLHGVIPACVTPFNADGSIDEGAARNHIADYLAAGVHGISVAGSQGEFYALDDTERLRLLQIAAEVVGGRVPIYAGTGATTTRASIRLTQAAEANGATVAMVITPYFISPNADELAEHYLAIARATRLPVILYNNPPRTGGLNVPPALLNRLATQDNIIGIKDSSGDLTQLTEYLVSSNYRHRVYIGRDTLILSGILQGAAGAISPAANVFPRLVTKLYALARAGELEAARALSDLLQPLRAAWAMGSFPVVIKESM